ncbi:MAG: hypothetical protein K6F86_12030 [Lachnospiraceae bacterium]|nr:hypothetical protein [Lachnospiraceae bacterium]
MADDKELPVQSKEERKEAAKKIKEEKKALRAQAKELKKQQKAIDEAAAEDEEEGGALSVILVTVVIVIIWLAILALLIKLDIGGFGSNVLAPVLKDVPVINKVLPEGAVKTVSDNEAGSIAAGYENLEEAVDRIKELEQELDHERQVNEKAEDTIDELTAELARLKTYEDNQIEFEKIKDEFDNEVVFNSKAPDISEYQKYYEKIDPTNAEILYKEVIRKQEVDKEVKDYAKAYSSMKPAKAAAIFASDPLRSDLELAAKILGTMSADARGAILAQIGDLDADLAGNITRIMEPEEDGQ